MRMIMGFSWVCLAAVFLSGCAMEPKKSVVQDAERGIGGLEVIGQAEYVTVLPANFRYRARIDSGADIVIDKSLGPMMLELNARPGLAIQVANGEGLQAKLEGFESMGKQADRMTPEERVRLALERVLEVRSS